jgi:threonine dehydrogenase-like Zn-dependent dehydrogenase
MVLRERPVPEPGPGEVLVRVEFCGVCSSDLGYLAGSPAEGRHLGHEVVGRVETGVGDVRPGRYAVQTSDGFGDHVVVAPQALVPVPDGLQPRFAALAEPVACAVMAADRSVRTPPPTRALLVGAGFMGLVLVRLLAARGIDVTALDPDPEARRGALDMGAQIATTADELHGEADFDLVLECVGNQAALDVAVRHVAIGGLLSIVGYHQSAGGLRSFDVRTLNFRGVDIVNAHERDEATIGRAMARALVLLSRGILDGSALVTDTTPLSGLPALIDARRPGKHLIECGD